MQTKQTAIKGPGLGEKNNELKEHLRQAAKLIEKLAAELHSSARFHNNRYHDTPSWQKCKDWHCTDARKFIEDMTAEIPELKHNPFALRQYRANLRKLQKAIRQAPEEA